MLYFFIFFFSVRYFVTSYNCAIYYMAWYKVHVFSDCMFVVLLSGIPEQTLDLPSTLIVCSVSVANLMPRWRASLKCLVASFVNLCTSFWHKNIFTRKYWFMIHIAPAYKSLIHNPTMIFYENYWTWIPIVMSTSIDQSHIQITCFLNWTIQNLGSSLCPDHIQLSEPRLIRLSIEEKCL